MQSIAILSLSLSTSDLIIIFIPLFHYNTELEVLRIYILYHKGTKDKQRSPIEQGSEIFYLPALRY